jgi:predicted nuclease of predicted toxin-antitoxin system
MTIWTDAQLSPSLAPWITQTFGVDALAIRDIGLRDASDEIIFQSAKKQDVVVMTKDRDFVELVQRHGHPPKVIWITLGNTSNDHLKLILTSHLMTALAMLDKGESVVEITSQW